MGFGIKYVQTVIQLTPNYFQTNAARVQHNNVQITIITGSNR